MGTDSTSQCRRLVAGTLESMAVRHDDLSPEEQDRQRALDRSWAGAQEALKDPEFRARLEASIARVNESDATPLTREEFLAETESSSARVVALGDISEFHAWVEREAPSRSAWSVARTFIAELGDVPWRAPSVPIAELSNQPEYEIRTAALEVAGESDVVIWWLHVYATGDVDIIAVTNR